MAQYRKKPVVIEAMQLTMESIFEVEKFIHGTIGTLNRHYWEQYEDIVRIDGMEINTLEGKMTAKIGDFIIKGIQGEFYPCKPDIFEKTYELVN